MLFETKNMGEEQGMLILSTVLGQDISDDATTVTLIPYAAAYPGKRGKLNVDYKQAGEKSTIKSSKVFEFYSKEEA
jgi:hypothetical protein